MRIAQWTMNTIIGKLYLVASEKALQGVFWDKQSAPIVQSLKGKEAEIQILARSAQQIHEYLEGSRKVFDLPLEIKGTTFQKKVWNQLSKIPYGETCSYKDIAVKIRNPFAVRAVGTANGRNSFSIIIPCHRVISSDGSLGGYAGGLKTKTQLLEIER